jgi:hypothetical protein
VRDYSDYYATLGVTADTDWETLRANYRRLIGQWHPDRFSDDPATQRIAEERSKQIILAYQALETYRRDHGLLPPIEPVGGSEGPSGPAHKVAPASGRSGFQVRSEMAKAGALVRESAKRGRWRRIALAFPALIVVLYLIQLRDELWAPDEDEPRDTPRITSASVPTPQPTRGTTPPPQPTPGTTPTPRPARGISTGSTLGEVYSIQGIPTWVEGETWHYGKSQIRFAQGKVIYWNEHPDNPLQIAGNPFTHSREKHFNIGSTKDEVRAIQGAPVTETDAVWDYAPSRVYFERNRVIRWQESPLQPLRVPH